MLSNLSVERKGSLAGIIFGALILHGCASINPQTFSFSGNWKGTLIQPDSASSPYGAVLTLVYDQAAENRQMSDAIGLIEYPSLSCGGYLTLAEGGFPEILLKETIVHGRCTNYGVVKLRAVYDDGIYFKWYGRTGKDPSVYGPLSRDTSRSYSAAEVARKISAYKAVEQAQVQQLARQEQQRRCQYAKAAGNAYKGFVATLNGVLAGARGDDVGSGAAWGWKAASNQLVPRAIDNGCD